MLNTNLSTNPQTSFGGGFPGVGGFIPGMSGAAPLQQMFMQSINTMQTTMMAFMTQMMSQQIAMLGSSAFGGAGGAFQGSPLGGFLGGIGGAGGGKASKSPQSGNAAQSQGQKIPGGKSLYKGRGMFHKGAPGAPNTYAFENSPAGIKFAAKHNYSSIDIDMQITKDGVPVATHWSKPLEKDGFYDPLGKIKKGTKVSDMTLAEVTRLRNKDGQSRIYTVATMAKELKKHGIGGDFEAKNDKRFATDKVMGYLANLVRETGIKANLKSIDRGPLTDKILKTAQDHGFWVRTAKGNGHGRKEYGYGN